MAWVSAVIGASTAAVAAATKSMTGDGIATIVAALIAAATIFVGYVIQQSLRRKERRAEIYSEAVRAVEDYLEAPYRIRRKDDTAGTRQALVVHVSDVQSRISYYRGMLSIYAPKKISVAYEELVAAARREAGVQMTAAWKTKPLKSGREVPLIKKFDRSVSDRQRSSLLRLMRLRRFR